MILFDALKWLPGMLMCIACIKKWIILQHFCLWHSICTKRYSSSCALQNWGISGEV